MPAPKLYLSSHDIATITGVSIRSAQNMLFMFSKRGQVIRSGVSDRGRLVSVDTFARFLCEQDGGDPYQRKRDIMEFLKEYGGGKRKKVAR